MTIRVLIVDDSSFFRHQVRGLLKDEGDIQVVGEASNGRESIDLAKKLKPDVITMDYEMPLMDGITAVKAIMAETPTAILMFSSMTTQGARVTLDALDAGALDYLPKYREQISGNQRSGLKRLLLDKVRSLYRGRQVKSAPSKSRSAIPKLTAVPKLIAIGTSTGGPVALQKILTQLPASFPVPIILVQHMPAAFTGPFAQRLDALCKIRVEEAKDGSMLTRGTALLAPGGMQMMVSEGGRIRVINGDDRLNYKPSVDISFASAAKQFGSRVLAVVLTGMGADGREGAKLLRQSGAQVWVQDSASCVIDGMPASIRKANLHTAEVNLQEMASAITDACR